jgi:hypothetical protein
MRADTTSNGNDPTRVASSILLSGSALHAACRRLVAAIIRRWPLIATVEGAGFRASRDLDDRELLRCWDMANTLQNGVALRNKLATGAFLRGLFNPPTELDSRQAVALAKQIVASRRH